MELAGLAATAALRLPRGPHRVRIRRDVPVPMPDGPALLADHYAPAGVRRGPVILIRSAYGRNGGLGYGYGTFFARHGFQVVLQSVRGTSGSGGVFNPLAQERADGLATVAWLRERPWFDGTLAMHGPSYLGYTQWAIAADVPELKAMAVQVGASCLGEAAFPGEAFALESTLMWCSLTGQPDNPVAAVRAPRRTRRAIRTGRPAGELDALLAGAPVPFYRDLLAAADPATPLRKEIDHSSTVGSVTAPVALTAGWYDIFLPFQLRDYLALRAAGRYAQLTVGPWFHTDVRHFITSTRDTLDWFRAHLLGRPSVLREQAVRLYVTGAGEWRDYPEWPVPGMAERRFHLQSDGGLSPDGPADSPPDRYRFDPSDPTPAPRGPVLIGDSRPADNRALERRPDVLTYTTPALPAGLETIGPVTAELYVRSSRECSDFGVRLCDVHPDGTSLSLSEGVRRLTPAGPPTRPDGVRRVRIELWPIGHRFRPGHRIRVQVFSGATPRLHVNPGTGVPLGSATTPVAAEQEVFHDPDRPSAIILPVVGA